MDTFHKSSKCLWLAYFTMLMPKEKVLGMSHKRFFLSRTQKESIFGEFFLDVNFDNTSNANLLDVFL